MTSAARAERPIYLDYAATTPVDPAVARAMSRCLQETFGNPSSMHAFGREAAALVERARALVASLVGAAAEQIIFTSGATESNNLAVLGVARANADRGRHIITSRIEHKSVLDACRRLEKEGFRITRLAPDGAGTIAPDAVRAALRQDTVLVSIMHVSNEIGVIQDIEAIGRVCREAGVAFHSDAAQSAGRLPIDAPRLPVDILSLTSHKIYGPKGIGALYIRRGARALLGAQLFGGGQEQGLRPGTLPTHQIVGFGVAAQLVLGELVGIGAELAATPRDLGRSSEIARIEALRDRLWAGIGRLPGVHLNGDGAPRVPHILNVSIEAVDGESLIAALDSLALSAGAACSSASGEPSHVLRALGRGTRLAESSLRLSLGRYTTAEEIDQAAACIEREVLRLRRVAPRRPEGHAPLGATVSAARAATRAAAPVAACAAADGGELDSGRGDLISASDGLSTEVSRLFRELPCAGVIPDGGDRVLTGEAGGPDEEVWVRFHVAVDATDTVKDARFEARGCPHTLAAASWIAARLPGRRRAEAIPGGPQAWARALEVPTEKLGRLLAVEDALIACLGLAQPDGVAQARAGAGHSEADRR